MTTQQQTRARFGPAWWDRQGHATIDIDGRVTTHGIDGDWPRPCAQCVAIIKADQADTNHEVHPTLEVF